MDNYRISHDLPRCKVCNEVAQYPHYVSNDGSVTCEPCTVKKEIKDCIPNLIEKINNIDSLDTLYLLVDIVKHLGDLDDRDMESIKYVLKNVKERY